MSLRKLNQKKGKLSRGVTLDDFMIVPMGSRKEAVTRRSSVSLTSISSDSDTELSPTLSRRGRRPAIVDTKNVGDVSNTISTDDTPYGSCDEHSDGRSKLQRKKSIDLETETYHADRVLRERRKKLIKRNTISDFYKARENVENLSNESRKGKQTFPFSFNKLIRTKSKEDVSKLGEFLSKIKASKFQDSDLAAYKTFHWSDLIARTENDERPLPLPDSERKRREAIWELFTSECVFLIDHLMVLKHCFMEPLKKAQVEGHLMFAEPSEIFGNLDELCYVSYSFCKELITVLIRNLTSTEMWNTDSLIDVLDKFSKWSEDGKVYHTYCLNYTKSLEYLEKLRKNDEFCEFEKWSGLDARCKRLQLNDLLVAPMQHCTKLPLLLSNIRKYSSCDYDKSILALTIGKVEISLRCLEEKMRRKRNTQRLQEIQQQLLWPNITDIDPRAYIPEFLRPTFATQPCAALLACPHRLLLHEGPLTLVQTAKCIDINLFLFDDMLLLAKVKKGPKKKQGDGPNATDKVFYVVYRQPLALDRVAIHDVDPCDIATNGMKQMFVLVHMSRFQQIIGVYTLQCPNEFTKDTWVTKIFDAKSKNNVSQPDPCLAVAVAATESRQREQIQKSPRSRRRIRMLKHHQKKSMSMDTLYSSSH